jgi:inosose dehydratase
MLETHPNLSTNGQVSRRTMLAVGHPNVRINYDTANIYFYNEGLDTLAELNHCVDFVAGMHLKDSKGLYRTFDFPVLGQGIVDFPRVFETLRERDFRGPCTMELEVAHDVPIDEAATKARVEESVAYLRRIGAMD